MAIQEGWRWCSKCQVLSFTGGSTPSVCAAGGQHDTSHSGKYVLTLNDPNAPGQQKWQWCKKCQTLSYAGLRNPGACPGGGLHDHAGSGKYTLRADDPLAPGQGNWQWCKKCQALTFAGAKDPGKCPAGGKHDHTGSGNYVIAVDSGKHFTLKNKAVDLRPKIIQMGLTVRDQFPRGTCTLFATTFLIEYLTAAQKGSKNLNLSEEYLNAVANRAADAPYDGSNFAEAVEGYDEFGIVPEASAPYQAIFDPKYLQGADETTLKLLETGKTARFLEGAVSISPNVPSGFPGLTDEQFLALLEHLDNGVPVAVGHGGDADNTKYVDIGNGKSAYADYDIHHLKNPYAHTVPLVGYKLDITLPGGGYLIFRNSGGPNWNDAGYGYMTFDYVQRYSYDTLIFTVPSIGVPIFHHEWILKRKIFHENVAAQRRKVTVPFLKGNDLKKVTGKPA